MGDHDQHGESKTILLPLNELRVASYPIGSIYHLHVGTTLLKQNNRVQACHLIRIWAV